MFVTFAFFSNVAFCFEHFTFLECLQSCQNKHKEQNFEFEPRRFCASMVLFMAQPVGGGKGNKKKKDSGIQGGGIKTKARVMCSFNLKRVFSLDF